MDAIKPYAQLLLPGECYDEFFVALNFGNVECLKTFISKSLGYAIILGSMAVKLPQILTILMAKSGEGLSMLSTYLELLAFSFSCAYGYVSGFPFSSYGDALFLLVQTSIIALLCLLFSGQFASALLYLTAEAAVLWFLFLSGLPSYDLIWSLQAVNMPIVAISKMIQAVENYKNGSTGQLSGISIGLMFLGSVARVFTSFQETGDMTLILTFIVSSLCNGILLTQIIMYRNAGTSKSAARKKTN